MKLETKVKKTIDLIQSKYKQTPEIGIILGSGLGVFQDRLQNPTVLEYKDIPYFPQTTVLGHAGKLLFGEIHHKKIVMMSGRFHYYEGYDMADVVYPVRVMAKLGIKLLIVTNAAGGINKSYHVGDFMCIQDHVNMIGVNPLRGKNEESFGPRFPDMSFAYNAKLRTLLKEVAKQNSIRLQEGVYIAIHGPSYETPAEIRMMRTIGGDAVGMSTAPEVIVASHMGIEVLGVSCITNMAAGVLDQALSHDEVFETAKKNRDKFILLLEEFIKSVKVSS